MCHKNATGKFHQPRENNVPWQSINWMSVYNSHMVPSLPHDICCSIVSTSIPLKQTSFTLKHAHTHTHSYHRLQDFSHAAAKKGEKPAKRNRTISSFIYGVITLIVLVGLCCSHHPSAKRRDIHLIMKMLLCNVVVALKSKYSQVHFVNLSPSQNEARESEMAR